MTDLVAGPLSAQRPRMDLLTLVLVLAVVGFLLWLIVTYIPMPEPFGKAIVVLVVVVLVVWLGRLLLAGGPVLHLR